MMIKFECCHADTCLPDYWSGHHLPHVQIPVWRGMTLAQVKSALRSELSQGAVMGSTDNARLLSADAFVPYSKDYAYQVNKAAHDSIDAIELKDPENDHCFMDMEESTDDDCWESVYAFFVFVEIED
jgi:hypothetical protein